MRRKVVLVCLLLAVVQRTVGQSFSSGNSLPCEQPGEDPDPNNDRDNLSCPLLDQNELECYSRAMLCDGVEDCAGGSDEGRDIVALECDNQAGPTFVCIPGENIDAVQVCDGIRDCSNGDDETTTLCENKCLLPYYGGCSNTRECISSEFDVNCGDCLGGFGVRTPPVRECSAQIRLERNTYTASEVNEVSEEICAVLIAASNTDINVTSVLMEIGITTIVGTITPREGVANAATATADFDAQPKSVSLSLSQPRDCIQVDIVNDLIADPNEVFEVVLTTNTVNAIVLDGADTATVTISNNIVPVTFSLPNGPLSVQEGNTDISVCVTKTGQTELTIVVTLFTREQSARRNDFMEINAQLQFNPEDSESCVQIAILSDNFPERPEEFQVFIRVDDPSSAAEINPSVLTVVINDESYVECKSSEFECFRESLCLPQSYVCDGVKDCLFSFDEWQCNTGTPCRNGEIRLTGGSLPNEGLVEMCINGSFSTLCLDGLDIFESTVVCKALNYSGAGVWVSSLREFGITGSDPSPIPQLDCTGSETELSQCTIHLFQCSDADDAGIRCLEQQVCEHGNTRLVGGSGGSFEGKVEVCFQGLWGSIITDSWDFAEARVVCKSLGRDEYGALPIPRFSYATKDDIIFATFSQCNGFEEGLLNCSFHYAETDDNVDDYLVGVRCDALPSTGCNDGDIRLVARESEASGQVEVCFRNEWGKICSQLWDVNAAMVVCRQLQLNYTEGSAIRDALGNPSTPILLDYIECSGDEENLLECETQDPQQQQRKKRQQTCETQEAGVVCAESPRILLSPPSENREYNIEVGREVQIGCTLENVYPQPFNFIAYQVNGNERIPIDEGGTEVYFVNNGVGAEATGTYICRAENQFGSSQETVHITVAVPSGLRSRAYLRFSVPRLEDRFIQAFEEGDITNFLRDVEIFSLNSIDERTPGQQLVQCINANRTSFDLERKRDRFECAIDNYPPLENNQTAVAQFIAEYFDAQRFAITSFNVSVLGFCDSEPSEYDDMWPETEANHTVTIPCEGGMATRRCSAENGGQWLPPDKTQCDPGMFCCSSEELCISGDRVCDRIAHCLNGDDEFGCPPVVTNCRDGEVRLSRGLIEKEGIIEMCVNGAFGALWEDIFTLEIAKVTCRELFGRAEGAVDLHNVDSLIPIHPISLFCDGNENNLMDCDREEFFLDQISADDDMFKVAAVRCQDPVDCQDDDLRLVGGNNEREGSLQICRNGVWGSICERRSTFSYTEASIACDDLGHNPAGALVLPSEYFLEDSSVRSHLSDVKCTGTEESLSYCGTGRDDENGSGDDEENNDCDTVFIRCDEYLEDCENGNVRLRNRSRGDTGYGVVELCLNNQWGTLCRDGFSSSNEAPVVCEQLGFSPEGSRSFSELEMTLEQERVIHRGSFRCSGAESSLLECDFNNNTQSDCSNFVLTVECSSPPILYLRPPPDGNDNTYMVEVGHDFKVTCNTADTYPESHTIGFRVGSGGTSELCSESSETEDRFEILEFPFGISSNASGVYQCVACNDISTVIQTFTVNVQTSDGEGSSAYLRMSLPIFERLSKLFDMDFEVEEFQLLDLLQALISSRDVIKGEEGIQTIDCLNAGRIPADVDAQRNRYECKITSYPPTNRIMKLVEQVTIDLERLSIVFASLITSETGFCGYEVDEREWGTYMWPETEGGKSVSLTCQLDSTGETLVTRNCLNGGGWDMADYDACIHFLPNDITADNVDEANEVASAIAQGDEQTDDNAQMVRDVLLKTAELVRENASLVNEEIVSDVVEVLNGLQDWPDDVIQTDNAGAEIVESFEIILLGLAQQENFTELTITNENIAVMIESVDINEITTGRNLAASEGNETLNITVSSESGLAPDQIASGFLPLSLFDLLESNDRDDTHSVPIVFAVLRTGGLFSIENNQDDTRNVMTSVGSPVVSLTVGVDKTFTDLPDPVIVNVRILVQNFTNPRCVSYDFDKQAWVTDGCTTIQTSDEDRIICQCNHLTNFASLVDICTRTEEGGCGQSDDAKRALSIISIIGVILSGVGLILTIFTLLIFQKLRSRDASKFHVQLCLALLGMLLVFVVGIDRTEVFGVCVFVSVLIHYFTLVAVMWMGAEALLMYRKLIIVFGNITTRFIIIISLICWLGPIVPAVVPSVIDPHFMITDTDSNHFCFIGDVRVFFGAFLGPIFAILLFNTVIFILIAGVLVKHSRNKVGKAADNKSQRKSNIRLTISLFGIMFLFGLTWLLAAFTFSGASLVFQILFAVFNSLQGFFIFIFFCALSSDVRQLWLEVVCGRRTKQSTYSTGGRGYSSGQQHPGAKKGPKTASSGLSSVPTEHYTSNSIELSENPSSTVLENSNSSPGFKQGYASDAPFPLTYQPPASSRAHFTTEAYRDSPATEESMEMSINFQ